MNMPLFVTGTDTGVGKTVISAGLVQAFRNAGEVAHGFKPVASGATRVGDRWLNEDVIMLKAASTSDVTCDDINFMTFEPAIAPHLAAHAAGCPLDLDVIVQWIENATQRLGGRAVIEGAGGWRVPLSDDALFSDIPKRLGIPVILVVGVRLGCINHALLTDEAIRADGLVLAGWVANVIEHTPEVSAIIQTLESRMSAPCIGRVPCFDACPDPLRVADCLDIGRL